MVVGASGVLGRMICTKLFNVFNSQMELIITDYKAERGMNLARFLGKETEFRYLDVMDKESILKSIKGVDIVLITVKQAHPYIQRCCIENQIACIDVTPFYDFVSEIKLLHSEAKRNEIASVPMSGFFPGLSGVLASKAAEGFHEIHEMNIGLLQSTNAKAGLTGILDMLAIISERVDYIRSGDAVSCSGFTKTKEMNFKDLPIPKSVRLIKHAEKDYLSQHLGTDNINYWTSWDSQVFNKLISLMRYLGVIKMLFKFRNSRFLSKIARHNPAKGEIARLTVEVKGILNSKVSTRELCISVPSDYQTTALVTARLAESLLCKNIKGMVLPFEFMDLEEIFSDSKDHFVLTQSTN